MSKRDGIIMVSDVMQVHRGEQIFTELAAEVEEAGLAHCLYRGQAQVFRNTTFYNCLYQYLHPEEGIYNQHFQMAIDALCGRKREPLDVLVDLAGYKEGEVRLLVMARNGALIVDIDDAMAVRRMVAERMAGLAEGRALAFRERLELEEEMLIRIGDVVG